MPFGFRAKLMRPRSLPLGVVSPYGSGAVAQAIAPLFFGLGFAQERSLLRDEALPIKLRRVLKCAPAEMFASGVAVVRPHRALLLAGPVQHVEVFLQDFSTIFVLFDDQDLVIFL